MENTKTLVIHSCKSLSAREANTIRVVIPDDTLAELKELSRNTGMAMSQVCRLLIEHALPQVEVKE